MTELTIVGTLARRFAGRRQKKTVEPTTLVPPPRVLPTGPTRLARMLALAYHVENLIDRGEFLDYAQAARALSITRARVSQIADLRLLPTSVQEDILLGRSTATERQLRALRGSPASPCTVAEVEP